MVRFKKTRSVLVIAAALAASASALTPAQAATPASGSLVINESNAFVGLAAHAGIAVAPLSPATGTYSSTTGLSASFPVTGGVADIANFAGSIQVGGGLVVVDVKTGRCLSFHQLAFGADTFQLTGVPDGTSTPVVLLDVTGDAFVSPVGVKPETLTSELAIDAEGAQYADSALHTTFFTAGQDVGALSITYTPAS